MRAFEVNFDGLVGPTHHYGGLSYGNMASSEHKNILSNPKSAALQGLNKMKLLSDMGLVQGVLPPQRRPHIDGLKRLGFLGDDALVLNQAYSQAPEILSAHASASAMWAANAAWVAPSSDTPDGRVHLTPANLITTLHRSLEAIETRNILQSIFFDQRFFQVHKPVTAAIPTADEGSANGIRFCRDYGEKGVHLFVYGRDPDSQGQPKKFPARQTKQACQAIARLHGLDLEACLFAQQNPEAIDKGVFHNDVISTGNKTLFLCHEKAFVDTQYVVDALKRKVQQQCKTPLVPIVVTENEIPIELAVSSYFFNSQIVSTEEGTVLVAPIECEQTAAVKQYIERLIISGGTITQVMYVDTRQSMQNGGGPACLRLRVVLTEEQLRHLHGHFILTDALYFQLTQWIERNYRDSLTLEDMIRPGFVQECHNTLDELDTILKGQ